MEEEEEEEEEGGNEFTPYRIVGLTAHDQHYS